MVIWMEEIVTSADLAQAIEDGRVWATCSPPSVRDQSRIGFGLSQSKIGQRIQVSGLTIRCGAPERMLGVAGTLTGRYVVPDGCRWPSGARWEVRFPGNQFGWMELDELEGV